MDHNDGGDPVARKVFVGEPLSKLILYVLTGAPHPYGWNEHAVRAALCRREILALLVRYWFGARLRLPRTAGWAWNQTHLAYEMSVEFIDGCHVPLRCSMDPEAADAFDELVHRIMRPLQGHLIEAGFDGQVWQAGLGNPTGAANFMLESGSAPEWRWVWVDLESGVPALFPINPLALLRFYLPRSVRHGQCLFDDVDVPKLRRYIEEHRILIGHRL